MSFELARLDDLLFVFRVRKTALNGDNNRLIHFVGYDLSD
jgi:hypothetical protein